MTTDTESHDKIVQVLKAKDPSAHGFTFETALDSIFGSKMLYVAWKSKDVPRGDSFSYVTVDSKGAVLVHDDGILAAKYLCDVEERKRSLVQRLSEFRLTDLIAAFIAIVVTGAFVIQLLVKGTLGQELVAIFGIILGYYFGKNFENSNG